MGTISEHLWADFPIDVLPTQSPEKRVEDLADETEAKRLVAMGVFVPAEEFNGEVTGGLTTKFVRDWRLKDYVNEKEETVKRWMRRSRYVAREFASEKRLDTFSPATGAHTSNLIPLKYLWMKEMAKGLPDTAEYETVLGCLDVKMHFFKLSRRSEFRFTSRTSHICDSKEPSRPTHGSKAMFPTFAQVSLNQAQLQLLQ